MNRSAVPIARRRGHLFSNTEPSMNRIALAAVVMLAAVLGVVSTSHADFYMSKRDATRVARHTIQDEYGRLVPRRKAVACVPYHVKYDPGYVYHHWGCAWATRPRCMDGA